MSEWQPIETAPKSPKFRDGNHAYSQIVLVFAGEVLRARWWEHKDGSSNFIQDGGLACYPTHWMPLPQPPQEPKCGLTEQLAVSVGAIERGHDPFCMSVLRGKDCDCGATTPPPLYDHPAVELYDGVTTHPEFGQQATPQAPTAPHPPWCSGGCCNPDEAPTGQQAEVTDDVGNLEYRGNSVSWWHAKAKAYGDTVLRIHKALTDAGYGGSGGRHVEDMLREALAGQQPNPPKESQHG